MMFADTKSNVFDDLLEKARQLQEIKEKELVIKKYTNNKYKRSKNHKMSVPR